MGKQMNLFKCKRKINTLTVFLCDWKIFGRTNRNEILKVNNKPTFELFWVFISFALAGGESTNCQKRNVTFFPPPVLYTNTNIINNQYLGLGLGLGLDFWGRDLQCTGMFLLSAEKKSISHPQGVLCTQQIPGVWHLVQVCPQPLGHLRHGEKSHSLR